MDAIFEIFAYGAVFVNLAYGAIFVKFAYGAIFFHEIRLWCNLRKICL
jgi:hypothetical protein